MDSMKDKWRGRLAKVSDADEFDVASPMTMTHLQVSSGCFEDLLVHSQFTIWWGVGWGEGGWTIEVKLALKASNDLEWKFYLATAVSEGEEPP